MTSISPPPGAHGLKTNVGVQFLYSRVVMFLGFQCRPLTSKANLRMEPNLLCNQFSSTGGER